MKPIYEIEIYENGIKTSVCVIEHRQIQRLTIVLC